MLSGAENTPNDSYVPRKSVGCDRQFGLYLFS